MLDQQGGHEGRGPARRAGEPAGLHALLAESASQTQHPEFRSPCRGGVREMQPRPPARPSPQGRPRPLPSPLKTGPPPTPFRECSLGRPSPGSPLGSVAPPTHPRRHAPCPSPPNPLPRGLPDRPYPLDSEMALGSGGGVGRSGEPSHPRVLKSRGFRAEFADNTLLGRSVQGVLGMLLPWVWAGT